MQPDNKVAEYEPCFSNKEIIINTIVSPVFLINEDHHQ